MRETIEEILRLAVNAPSGHNCQPWKFDIKDTFLFVWNMANKDKTLFNYKQRGSLISHGALIENIAIIASGYGYGVYVELFPNDQEEDLVAKLYFTESTKRYYFEKLLPYVLNRVTNRRPYQLVPAIKKHLEELESIFVPTRQKGFDIRFVDTNKNIWRASRAFSVGDRMLFENQSIHKALFSNVNWSLDEEMKKREGLFVGTKELSSFERIIFRYVLSNWSLINIMKCIEIGEKASRKRQRLYASSSAIGLIVAPDDSYQSFVQSGRLLQRVWLTATSLGLSFQPVSVGLLYIGQQLQQEFSANFTKNQITLVKEAYYDILNMFLVKSLVPMFSFRIGFAPPPTAQSLKKDPQYL